MKKNYEVITAASGGKDLAVLEREPIDPVLLDVWMPGTRGLEALSQIRTR